MWLAGFRYVIASTITVQVIMKHNAKKIENKILMVIVFYKVAALALKVFSKPFIDQTKKIHLSQDAKATHPILRNIFIGMGNRFNYY